MYTANAFSNDVSGYAIDAGGALTPLTGSPFPAGPGASAIVATNHDRIFRNGFE